MAPAMRGRALARVAFGTPIYAVSWSSRGHRWCLWARRGRDWDDVGEPIASGYETSDQDATREALKVRPDAVRVSRYYATPGFLSRGKLPGLMAAPTTTTANVINMVEWKRARKDRAHAS